MEHIEGYDEWKTTQPEPSIVGRCDCCGCDLWHGDGLYTIDGEHLCDECVKDNYRRIL